MTRRPESFHVLLVHARSHEVIAYAGKAESLGFDSLWAWDHMLLGSKRPLPFLESLTTLSAIASVTEQVELGTGVLVLPLRNPVVLAKGDVDARPDVRRPTDPRGRERLVPASRPNVRLRAAAGRTTSCRPTGRS